MELPELITRLIKATEANSAHLERIELMLARRLPRPTPVRKVGPNDAVPTKEIVAAFIEICPHLDAPQYLNNERRRDLRNFHQRFKNAEGGSMEIFRRLFEAVRDSDFLSGRSKGSTWKADMWWAIQPEHWTAIFEGRYSNEARHQNGHARR